MDVVERCAGHGGTFGVMKDTHKVAVKFGKTAARQIKNKGQKNIVSDCPLAGKHLGQLINDTNTDGELNTAVGDSANGRILWTYKRRKITMTIERTFSMIKWEIPIKLRKEIRKNVVEVKKDRRISLGPHATFYFENYFTMKAQIQEMLYIEKGGDEQLKDELAAYNPMIPHGKELTATLMFEIDNPI